MDKSQSDKKEGRHNRRGNAGKNSDAQHHNRSRHVSRCGQPTSADSQKKRGRREEQLGLAPAACVSGQTSQHENSSSLPKSRHLKVRLQAIESSILDPPGRWRAILPNSAATAAEDRLTSHFSAKSRARERIAPRSRLVA